jgi:hypothetical protein
MTRIVIASAAAFETDPLVSSLEKSQVSFTRLITGVGLTQSSINCARLADVVRGRHVFFICTGGFIGTKFSMQLYAAGRVTLAPYDVRQEFSEMVEGFDPHLEIGGHTLGLKKIDVTASVGVSVHRDLTSRYDQMVETMELYGVARAWLQQARSFSAFISTTNITGPSAREQWRQNFKAAAQMTAEQLAPKIAHFAALQDKDV